VQIKGLTKVYSNGKRAVNQISFNMYEDQITCLLGHNGAGKSSTMAMLTGMYEPTNGTALINGYDIRTQMPECRRSLGLCPQVNTLFEALTVEEHLRFFGSLKEVPAGEIDDAITSMVRDLGLEDKRRNFPSELSGGMRRKLCVGIAFMGGSKVVFLGMCGAGQGGVRPGHAFIPSHCIALMPQTSRAPGWIPRRGVQRMAAVHTGCNASCGEG
jgi:ABC-type multidrug transport system ATPase subunit